MKNNSLSYTLFSIAIIISCFSNLSWGQQNEKFFNDFNLAINYIKQNKAVKADSIFSSLDDRNAVLLDSMERGYYYFKGLAKFSLNNSKDALPYFEKTKIITDSLKIFDFDYLNINNFLSQCYFDQKEYNKAESCLRGLIVKHNELFETYPSQAAYTYSILARIYEEKGDTIMSESIHYDKIQYYFIKSYIQESPNDHVGQEIFDSYSLTKTVMNDYYSYTRPIDSEYIRILCSIGEDMETIGADYEAKWCYENCIRNGNSFLGKYNKAQKWSYLNLLKLYASNKEFDAFNSLLPIAIDYINNIKDDEKDNKDNEFALGKVYGNIFLEQGDYEEAYKCYLRSKKYLENGNLIPEQRNQEIQLYLLLSRTCLNLRLYDETLTYCDSIENLIDSEDKSNQTDLFNSRLFRSEVLVNTNNFNRANDFLDLLKQQTIKDYGTFCIEYIKVCYYKALNYYRQERDVDVINELLPILETSYDKYSEIWGDYWFPLYTLQAYAYIGTLNYSSALKTLEKLAEIEKHINGEVSDNTKELINECKTKL